jgi:hypothetical protein
MDHDQPGPPQITIDKINGNERRRLVIDEDAAAGLLGVSPRTLQRWRQEGEGPAFVRIGKRRMYRPGDLEAFVEAGRVQP